MNKWIRGNGTDPGPEVGRLDGQKEHFWERTHFGGNRSFCLDGGKDEILDIDGQNGNWMDNVNCE
jgi:hypothetical protein